MSTKKSSFQVIGNCYYYALAINTLALITFGTFQFILRYSQEIKLQEFSTNFLNSYSTIFIYLTFYLSFCMVLNLMAALCFYHTKNPKLILFSVLSNFFCFPIGTVVSLFTLYILKKLNQSFH